MVFEMREPDVRIRFVDSAANGYCRKHYWTNHEKFNERKRARVKNYRARNRRYVEQHILRNPCVDCGLLDPLVMEFDHISGKKIAEVSNLVRNAAPLSVIVAEIAKCVVRCANCHRRRTALTLWGKKQPVLEGFEQTLDD